MKPATRAGFKISRGNWTIVELDHKRHSDIERITNLNNKESYINRNSPANFWLDS